MDMWIYGDGNRIRNRNENFKTRALENYWKGEDIKGSTIHVDRHLYCRAMTSKANKKMDQAVS